VETGWDSRASGFQRTFRSGRRFQSALVVRCPANASNRAAIPASTPARRFGVWRCHFSPLLVQWPL
ncbi:MAG: hypothetical protein KJ063_25975, partial [Anaerolineae bacterium]|nr:hypothetical protein [Anaerolineae bacterium]